MARGPPFFPANGGLPAGEDAGDLRGRTLRKCPADGFPHRPEVLASDQEPGRRRPNPAAATPSLRENPPSSATDSIPLLR